MKLPDFLTTDKYGFIHLVGHRIGLNHVINLYNEGNSPQQILEEFDTLSSAFIHQLLAYYHANKAEVDAYIAEHDAEVQRQIAEAPRRLDMDELRRRFALRHGREET
jgi:uncharacterized protein (DUF433 family)